MLSIVLLRSSQRMRLAKRIERRCQTAEDAADLVVDMFRRRPRGSYFFRRMRLCDNDRGMTARSLIGRWCD